MLQHVRAEEAGVDLLFPGDEPADESPPVLPAQEVRSSLRWDLEWASGQRTL